MANCDQHKNPLQRSGTSQKQRQLPGLLPDYVQIDERKFGDWIVFATEFAKYLKYYETTTGALSGNWQPFFQSNVTARLGSIAIQDIEIYRVQVKERMDFIKDNDNAGNKDGLKTKLIELFSAVITLSAALDEYYKGMTDETSYKTALENTLKKLAPFFRRLLAYYMGAKKLNLVDEIATADWKILGSQLTHIETVLDRAELSSIWWNADLPSWEAMKANTANADTSVFGKSTWNDTFREISHAANHHLFASIFDLYSGSYAKMVAEAEKALMVTLEQWNTHLPHYTLFLSFLKLYQNSTTQLNTLTWKHLDYYYKDILRLKPKAAVPDKVHLVAELAKHVDSAVLKAGSIFKAGKDSAGKEVQYALEKETTFNKAEIAQFKAVYLTSQSGTDDVKDAGGNPVFDNSGRLYAADIMNSADGAGGEIKNTNGEWHPFVNKVFDEEGKLNSINMPLAEIGFAVASHYLFLSEGKREIRICVDATGTALNNAKFICYITTEKKWLEIIPDAITDGTFTGGAACKEIVLSIPATDPAITKYDVKVHGGTYNTDVPVVKCILKNELNDETYDYTSLSSLDITQTEIKVSVGGELDDYNQDGAKELLLSNQNGQLDPSKPFHPYTAIPDLDMSLVIGNKELFSKKNAKFNLNVEWANFPGTAPTPTVTLEFLQGGKWIEAPTGTVSTTPKLCASAQHELFTEGIPTIADSNVSYSNPYSSYSSDSRAGFMRLVLNDDFGHSTYTTLLTTYFINAAKENPPTPNNEPPKPYTPLIKSLYLNYTANSDIAAIDDAEAFEGRPVQFFHVGPFGEAELHAALATSESYYLLPHFIEYPVTKKVDTDPEQSAFSADWYIGIKNLEANQAVNILFQLLDGSTNPLISKPDNHVQWSYLSNNWWIDFTDQDISDNTQGLVSSGIISFSIPGDATTNNTILPTGHLWLKATVSEAAEAVCKLLSVHAQAMTVVYQPYNNAADFLDTPLPAGTISKLKEAQSAIKKILQPYASFGGRQTESSKQFYLRSSEQLRHKGRAITIWDYERLVLEAFPQLHKVKCLNHTQVEDNTDAALSIYNENKPGYVAIITIPNLVNRNEVNPLKPYTNQNLLSDIKEFLQERISGHVNLNVCNPLFEEIRITFKLQLNSGYDDQTFYTQELQKEITRYLSPWAYTDQVEVQFGGKISKSQLINFIEERPYVDFITEVKLFHKPGEHAPESPTDFEEVEATTSRSVLVSAASAKHTIEPYQAVEAETQKECSYV